MPYSATNVTSADMAPLPRIGHQPDGDYCYGQVWISPGSTVTVNDGVKNIPPEHVEVDATGNLWIRGWDFVRHAPRDLSPEERAAWDARGAARATRHEAALIDRWHRHQDWERERRGREEREALAKRRATRLLLSLLDEQQRADFTKTKSFVVTGSLGGRYRITYGYSGNVLLLDAAGDKVASFCAHPQMYDDDDVIPDEDAMVAQMLALITDEKGYLETRGIGIGRYVSTAEYDQALAHVWPERVTKRVEPAHVETVQSDHTVPQWTVEGNIWLPTANTPWRAIALQTAVLYDSATVEMPFRDIATQARARWDRMRDNTRGWVE